MEGLKGIITDFFTRIPRSRTGIITEIEIDRTHPNLAKIYLDIGRKDYREWVKVDTKRILEENWAITDLVYLSFLGFLERVASVEDLEKLDADVEQLYSRFEFWKSYQATTKENEPPAAE